MNPHQEFPLYAWFHPEKDRWIRIRDPLAESLQVILFKSPLAAALPANTVVLIRRSEKNGESMNLLGHIETTDKTTRFTSPDIFMYEDPTSSVRRSDFRVMGLDAEQAQLRPAEAPPASPHWEAEIDDLSAGGVGLVICRDVLQEMNLVTHFHMTLNLAPPDHPEDLFTRHALLRNMRPLGGKRFHMGLQFQWEDLTSAQINHETGRLLRNVAKRQRELLRRRTRLDTDHERRPSRD